MSCFWCAFMAPAFDEAHSLRPSAQWCRRQPRFDVVLVEDLVLELNV